MSAALGLLISPFDASHGSIYMYIYMHTRIRTLGSAERGERKREKMRKREGKANSVREAESSRLGSGTSNGNRMG